MEKGYFWVLGTSRSGHHFVKNNIESWIGTHREYRNLEGLTPNKFYETYNDYSQEIYDKSVNILCLRDLLNWYTSIFFFIKKQQISFKVNYTPIDINHIMYIHERTPELEQLSYMHFINEDIPKQEYIDRKAGKYRVSPEKRIKYSGNIWLEAAKEFIGETNYMKNVVKVMYDDFVYSQEYRKHICEQVNGTYNESMLNIVPEAGNYSTFDGDAYQNRGSKMKVLERYKKWERIDSHLLILSFLKDSEALKFYIDNFELNDDKKRFIDEWLT